MNINFKYKTLAVILIISVIILTDGYLYTCQHKRSSKKRNCTLYVELQRSEFPKYVMPRLMEADRHNLQYLYNLLGRHPNVTRLMNRYVDKNLNQTNIARICTGFSIKFYYPTYMIFVLQVIQKNKKNNCLQRGLRVFCINKRN
ncbi:Hypothetical protein SRAE_2000507100 [Strongyloides ratti]|uniref:Uncharacterized protein n=1 Tax=Strongyloides ratti TaxID=34506 RepID=A0A090LKT0_STRRB|nr:Hypothetical protein SRAE_2000507100 [Strongyloides ratti]CEF70439.2 Hypothetical protein SRAE_2000507100 [Strongyloides ratti]